jgi:hypothetical protein
MGEAGGREEDPKSKRRCSCAFEKMSHLFQRARDLQSRVKVHFKKLNLSDQDSPKCLACVLSA